MGSTPTPRLLTLRSGGWVLCVAAGLMAIVLVWGLAGILVSRGSGRPPRSPAEYGFDLAHALVPLDLIAAGSEPGLINALHRPEMISANEVDEINQRERGSYLVSIDRVVGIEFGGEARAYPIRILQWHEVVNDVVGNLSVAITYNGLCDSAVVFDRSVNGRKLDFEVSGLLYNSNTLMYDRRDDGGRGGESLWSQLRAAAVTGPAAEAGLQLRVLPCALLTWGQWRALHPDTLVLAPNPDPQRERFYDRNAYGSYQSSDAIKFPVRPLPDGLERPLKERMIVVLTDGAAGTALSIDDLADRLPNAEGALEIEVAGRSLSVTVLQDPRSVFVRDLEGRLVPVMYAFWFAWHATSASLPQ